MKKFTKSDLTNLQNIVSCIPEDCSAFDIFKTLIEWLRKYEHILKYEPFEEYKIYRFLSLEAYDYPLDLSGFTREDLAHFKTCLSRYTIKNVGGIVRLIRDLLEVLLVFQVDRQCPSCGENILGVYKNGNDNNVLYECRQCYSVFLANGIHAGHTQPIYATRTDLDRWGFL